LEGRGERKRGDRGEGGGERRKKRSRGMGRSINNKDYFILVCSGHMW